jgi:hypothetical protein
MIDITNKLTSKLKQTDKGIEIELYYLDYKLTTEDRGVTLPYLKIELSEDKVREIEKANKIKEIKKLVEEYEIEPEEIDEDWGI